MHAALPSARHRAAVLAAASALLLAAGCARPGPDGLLPGYDPADLFAAQWPAEIAVDRSLAAPAAGERAFAVVEKGAVASLITMTTAPSGHDLWRSEIGGDRASVFSVSDTETLLIETTDFPNRAVTTFEPPLPLLSSALASGAELPTSHSVVVRSLHNVSRLVDRGTATQTLTRLDDQDVLLPDGGVHRAARFRRVLILDLGRADVEETTTSWYVPALGLAVEESEEKVKALGFLSWTKERLMLRVP